MMQGAGGGPRSAPVDGVDGNWRCHSCSNVNFGTRDKCNRCSTLKFGGGTKDSRGPVEGVEGNWRCICCSNINFSTRDKCNRCQTPNPGPGVPGMPAALLNQAALGNGFDGVNDFMQQPLMSAMPAQQSDGLHALVLQLQQRQLQLEGQVSTLQLQVSQQAQLLASAGLSAHLLEPAITNMPPITNMSSPPDISVFHRMMDGGAKRKMDAAPGFNMQPQKRGGAPVEGVDGNWRCQSCSNINFESRDKCNRCTTPRPVLPL